MELFDDPTIALYNESIMQDRVTYKMCCILEQLRGHGLRTTQEKFMGIDVGPVDTHGMNDTTAHMLNSLNRVEVLVGKNRITTPEDIMLMNPDTRRYESCTINFEPGELEDGTATITIRMIGDVDYAAKAST